MKRREMNPADTTPQPLENSTFPLLDRCNAITIPESSSLSCRQTSRPLMPFKSRKAKGGKYCKLYENINKILSFFFSFKISNKIITWREIVLGFSLNLLLLVFVHTSSPVLAKNKKTKAQLQRGKSDRAYSGSQKRGWRLIITRQYPPLTHIQLISAHSSRDEEPKVGSQVKMLQDWLTHFGWQ